MGRIVVTGGHGFIGSHLVERLVRDGGDVTVFDPAAAPPDFHPAAPVRHVRGDVLDENALAGPITSGVDVVYHLGAQVGVDRYLADPLEVIDVNVSGTRNVLRAAETAGAKVVFASSSEVYGKNPEAPWSEDADRVLGSTALDRWSYSSGKGLAEHMAFAFARRRGLPVVIVRYFNVYGPRQRPAHVVSQTVHRALRGLAPLVYDGGGQSRSFTFVDDVVEGTVLAGTSRAANGHCFNIGSDRETVIGELIRTVCELTGIAEPPEPVETGTEFGDRRPTGLRRVPDTRKASGLLGWQCRTPLRDGLAETIAWARRNPWWLATPVLTRPAGLVREHG